MTTQCGGNRRSGMNEVKKTMGISWGAGAISTARWGGVWLRDVLALAGQQQDVDLTSTGHVQFECLDKPFGVSIPMAKAVSYAGEVMLAYELNGEPLPREHGAPLRVVVPGYLGVRSAKWVETITAAKDEVHKDPSRCVWIP